MIVRNEHMTHAGQADAIVATVFLQASQPYSYIYEQCVGLGGQQVAVSTASTAKRDKLQHDFFVICVQNYKIIMNYALCHR